MQWCNSAEDKCLLAILSLGANCADVWSSRVTALQLSTTQHNSTQHNSAHSAHFSTIQHISAIIVYSGTEVDEKPHSESALLELP